MDKKSTLNISGAAIKKPETIVELNEGEKKHELSQEERSLIENLEDTKTVNVQEILKHNVEEEVKINFLNEDFSTSFTASKSKTSTAKPHEETTSANSQTKTDDELRAEIAAAENSSQQMDPQTFRDIAGFIVFLIDTGFSTGMKMWTGDSSDEPYSLSKPKQQVLINQLTMILIKYQARFKIEFMFIATIIVLYIPGVLKARANRKIIKQHKTTPVVQEVVRTTKRKEPVFETEQTTVKETKLDEVVKPSIMEQNDETEQFVTPQETTQPETQQEVITKFSKRSYKKKPVRKPGGRRKL